MALHYTHRKSFCSPVSAIVLVWFVFITAGRVWAQQGAVTFTASGTNLTNTNGQWRTFTPDFPNDINRVETKVFKMPVKGQGIAGVEFKLVGGDGGTAQAIRNFTNNVGNGGKGSTVQFKLAALDSTTWGKPFIVTFGKKGESKSINYTFCTGGGGGATGMAWLGSSQWFTKQGYYEKYNGPSVNIALPPNGLFLAGAAGGGGAWADPVPGTGIKHGKGGDVTDPGANYNYYGSYKHDCVPQQDLEVRSGSSFWDTTGVATTSGSSYVRTEHVNYNAATNTEYHYDITFGQGGGLPYYQYNGQDYDVWTTGIFNTTGCQTFANLQHGGRGGSGYAGGGAGGVSYGDDFANQYSPGGGGGGTADYTEFGNSEWQQGGWGGKSYCSPLLFTNISIMPGGNTASPASGSFAYRTIPDAEPPVARCKDVTITLTNGSVFFSFSIPTVITRADVDNGSTDNDAIQKFTFSKDTFTCAEIGVNTVIVTVHDVAGNTDTAHIRVTVIDAAPPAIFLSGLSFTKDVKDGPYTLTRADFPPASDYCTGNNYTFTFAPTVFTCSDAGTIRTVGYTLTDANGNSINLTQDFKIINSLATTIYVDSSATGANNGTSWANAYVNLQDALTEAGCTPSRDIYVAKGTYFPDGGNGITAGDRNATFRVYNGYKIYGGFPSGGGYFNDRSAAAYETILSGHIGTSSFQDNSYHIITVPTGANKIVLEGFTVTGGYGNESAVSNGAGITFLSTAGDDDYRAIISKCVFRRNVAAKGGAIGLDNIVQRGGAILENCVFDNNTASSGGGAILLSGSTQVHAALLLTNCLFIANRAAYGGAVYYNNAISSINNCTITGNSATSAGGAIHPVAASVSINNSILWNDRVNGNVNEIGAPAQCAFYYSDIAGSGGSGAWVSAVGSNGGNNIDADPQFLSATVFEINPSSPAVNAGNNSYINLSTDLLGHARVIQNAVDMGAYETSNTVFVAWDAPAGGDGQTWATALNTVSDGIDSALAGLLVKDVWIKTGTYKPDRDINNVANGRYNTFNLRGTVHLYGGFAGNEVDLNQRDIATHPTELSGDLGTLLNDTDNTYHIVTFSGTDVGLDGLVLQTGCANHPNDPAYRYGGAVYYYGNGSNIHSVIRNCVFRYNYAITGGAISVSNSVGDYTLDVIQSLFYENKSGFNGGAIYIQNRSLGGSGVKCNLISCTGARNSTAWTQGGFIATDAAVSSGALTSIYNSVLWANYINTPNNLANDYSNLNGGTTLTYNSLIGIDPLFADIANPQGPDGLLLNGDDGLRLLGPSPGINAGDNNFLPYGLSTDITRSERVLQDVVDAGAYESYGCLGLTKLYVDAQVDTSRNGSSWNNAFKYLSDALWVAGLCPDVDTIFVAQGTYYATGTNGSAASRDVCFMVLNPVVILGGYPAGGGVRNTEVNETVLSADINTPDISDNAYHILGIKNSFTEATVLDGFTFKNGNANGTGFDGHGFLRNAGAAIFANGANVQINRCKFTGNNATYAGGALMFIGSKLSSANCVYKNNSAPYGGAIRFDYGSITQAQINVTDNFFVNDTAGTGGGALSLNMGTSTGDTILNNVFINNYSAGNAAAIDVLGGNNYIVNNTFYGNAAPVSQSVISAWAPMAAMLVQNNLFYKNKAGANTLADINASGVTPVLLTNSSGINPQFESEINLAGEDEIWGTTDDGLMMKGTSQLLNAGTNIPPALTGTDVTGNPRIQFGTIDPGAYESGSRIKHWYVNLAQDSAIADGISWATAFSTFQQALSASRYEDTIWVAAGTYTPDAGVSFAMKPGVKIYGGFKGNEQLLEQRNLGDGYNTILQGNGNRVFKNTNVDAAALLDGFIVQGGTTDSMGGGMYNIASSPVLNNVVFSGNHAASGGAIAATAGSQPVITNALFAGNIATDKGGAVYSHASVLSLTNVTIAGDSAANGGAIATEGSAHLNLYNGIIWGNSADDIYVTGAQADIRYTLTQSTISGEGNIHHIDPAFISLQDAAGSDGLWFTTDDGLRLYNTSVAFNQGSNAFVSGIATDITGGPRIRSGFVNMGAYEDSSQTICDLLAASNQRILYVDATMPASGDGITWQTAFRTLKEALDLANYCNAVDTIRVAAGTYYPSGNPGSTDRTASFTILRSNLYIKGGYANRTGTYNRALYNTYLSGEAGIENNNADNSFHVVTVKATGTGSCIDGFIITGGYALGGGGTRSTDGAAVLNNAETFNMANCVVTNNAAMYGAILNAAEGANASIELGNCVITANTANYGGGLYNQALTNGSASAFLYNCTVAKNGALYNGAAIYNEDAFGLVMLVSTITWDNTTAPTGEPIFSNGNNSVWCGRSLFPGMLPTNALDLGDNLFTNPLFVNVNSGIGADGKWMTREDGLALKIGSPAIRTGALGSTYYDDITGLWRGSTPDMGAYQNPCNGPVFIAITTTACDSLLSPTGRYYWNTSGTYRDTLLSAIGCDTTYVVFLTVNHSTGSVLTATACSQYTSAGGHTWYSTGIYYDTLTSVNGCDSIVTIHLTITNGNATALNAVICASQSYAFNGMQLTASGTYSDTLTAGNGCDSIVTLNLTVLAASSSSINATICTGQSFTFNDMARTTSGTYLDTLQNVNGCDSVVTLILTVNPQIVTNTSQDICAGGSYNFNGMVLTAAGVYRDTLSSVNGCDSIIILNLGISNTLAFSFSQTICFGDSYLFNGVNLTAGGDYADTLSAAGGCDSIVTLHLTVSPQLITNINQTICAGSVFNFNGNLLTAAGIYSDTLSSITGCDSIIILSLGTSGTLNTSYGATICHNEIYLFNGVNLDASGTYMDTLTALGGCDSIITLSLTVLPGLSSAYSISICAGNAYNFNGSALTVAGTYTDTLTSIDGCDSIVTLSLVVDTLPSGLVTAHGNTTFCQGDSVELSAPLAGSYLWSTSEITQNIIVKATGSYSVTVTNGNNCQASLAQVSVTVNALPPVPVIMQLADVLSSTPANSYQWYFNNSLITGATSQSMAATQNGDYFVEVGDGNGCSNRSAVFNVTNVGVQSIGFSTEIKLYPNPNSGLFVIEFADNSEKEVEITSTVGEVVWKTISTESLLSPNLPNPAAGIYFVHVKQNSQVRILRFDLVR